MPQGGADRQVKVHRGKRADFNGLPVGGGAAWRLPSPALCCRLSGADTVLWHTWSHIAAVEVGSLGHLAACGAEDAQLFDGAVVLRCNMEREGRVLDALHSDTCTCPPTKLSRRNCYAQQQNINLLAANRTSSMKVTLHATQTHLHSRPAVGRQHKQQGIHNTMPMHGVAPKTQHTLAIHAKTTIHNSPEIG